MAWLGRESGDSMIKCGEKMAAAVHRKSKSDNHEGHEEHEDHQDRIFKRYGGIPTSVG